MTLNAVGTVVDWKGGKGNRFQSKTTLVGYKKENSQANDEVLNNMCEIKVKISSCQKINENSIK